MLAARVKAAAFFWENEEERKECSSLFNSSAYQIQGWFGKPPPHVFLKSEAGGIV